MTNIYPFKAIRPLISLEYHIHNGFINCVNNKFNVHNGLYENKIMYVNDLLQKDLLCSNVRKCLYCCRISNNNFSVKGTVALVNTELLNKKILSTKDV